MDDARRRDTGQHIDMTGGWHDAGDLRKWMTSALLSGAALSHMVLCMAKELAADNVRVNCVAPGFVETGFHAGGDDYLTKPFEFLELTARLQVLMRRGTTAWPRNITGGNNEPA